MDIKDVNSGLLNLLQANRVNAQNGAVNVSGFGDLLAGLESERSASSDLKADFREAKEIASADFSKVREKNKPVVRETVEAQSAAPKPERKNNSRPIEDRAASKADNSPRVSSDKSQTVDKMQSANDEAPADNTIADKKTINASEKNAASTAETETVPAEEMVGDVMVEASQETKMPEGDIVSLEALALMGVIAVVNPLNGELVQMTGAELAAQLAKAGIESVSVLPQDNNQLLVMSASTDAAEVGAFQEVLSVMQPIKPTKIEMVASGSNTQSEGEIELPVAEVAENQDVLEAQAAKLGEVIGKDHKAKIEVTVKAEKIADVIDNGLLKNGNLTDDVVAAIVEGDGKANPLTENKSSVMQPTMVQNTAAQVKDMTLAMTAGVTNSANVAAAADEASVAKAPSEIGSVTLAQAGTTGSEMLANAKPAAANDSASTSFRDVYKGMGKEVVDQIKVNITKSAVKGVDKIEIQLKPEDLGQIEVKMQIGKDGKLQAHIISSRPETAEMLQKEMASLQKAFNDAGFQTDEGSLSFSFREDGQAGQNQEKNNLRNFIGNVLEQENMMDAASGDLFAGTAWDGQKGLNIRV